MVTCHSQTWLAGHVQVAYFVNSGSEANDLAVLMARLHTGNFDLVALRNCYHGLSETTMGMMGNSGWRQPVPCVSPCQAQASAKFMCSQTWS